MRMSVPNNDIETIRSLRLSPHQAEFVQGMLASSLPVRRLLVGPPGSGKTVAATALAQAIAQQNPQFRILVITPGALTAAHEYNLKRKIPGLKTAVLSRRDIRELESKVSPGQPVWPTSFAAVMGMDTARRDDVYDLLKAVSWDLVIAEEVHLFARSRWTLLRRIISDGAFQRVLLVTGAHELPGLESLLKKVPRITWNPTQLRESTGQHIFRANEPRIKTVPYRRGTEEQFIVNSIAPLLRNLNPTGFASMFRKILVRQASSSPMALERTLKHLRNALVHDAGLPDLASQELSQDAPAEHEQTDSDIQSSSKQARTVWKNKATALIALTTLLDRIDSLANDAKREALVGLIHQLDNDKKIKHIVIFCSSKVTASYVQSVTAQLRSRSWLLTAETSSRAMAEALAEFRMEGGILVSTAIALTGIDLRYVQVLIHYDPPISEVEMLSRLSRSLDATNYILTDTSDVLPDEWKSLQNISRTA